MNGRRVMSLSLRVVTQIVRDRRTFVLLIVVPIMLLLLGNLLFDADSTRYRLGVIDRDKGVDIPGGLSFTMADHLRTAIRATESLTMVELDADYAGDTERALREAGVDAVLTLAEDMSSRFVSEGMLYLVLELEGSDPATSGMIQGLVHQLAVRGLATFATTGPASRSLMRFFPQRNEEEDAMSLPVEVDTRYAYGTGDFEEMDYIAPVYINFLILFFVFLLACVFFIRERTHGTMERLLATPTTRPEIILGYMAGLGVFALAQSTVIIVFTVAVLQIRFLGSLALLFVIVVLLSVVGVSLGMLASSFARTEFQVVQFIPLLIIPQLLVGGTFIQVEALPALLKPVAYCMPLTYANIAMRDVMLKGWGLSDIWPNLLILLGFAALLILLDMVAVKREID